MKKLFLGIAILCSGSLIAQDTGNFFGGFESNSQNNPVIFPCGMQCFQNCLTELLCGGKCSIVVTFWSPVPIVWLISDLFSKENYILWIKGPWFLNTDKT